MSRVLRLLLTSFILNLGSPGTALSQSDDALALFTGRWVWVGHRDKHGADQACKDHWEQYEVSTDRRDIKLRTAKRDVEGRGYRVLYSEGNSAVMYLGNEDRRLANGDRLIWILIMETPDRFRWRIYGNRSDPDEEAKYARVRCR